MCCSWSWHALMVQHMSCRPAGAAAAARAIWRSWNKPAPLMPFWSTRNHTQPLNARCQTLYIARTRRVNIIGKALQKQRRVQLVLQQRMVLCGAHVTIARAKRRQRAVHLVICAQMKSGHASLVQNSHRMVWASRDCVDGSCCGCEEGHNRVHTWLHWLAPRRPVASRSAGL